MAQLKKFYCIFSKLKDWHAKEKERASKSTCETQTENDSNYSDLNSETKSNISESNDDTENESKNESDEYYSSDETSK